MQAVILMEYTLHQLGRLKILSIVGQPIYQLVQDFVRQLSHPTNAQRRYIYIHIKITLNMSYVICIFLFMSYVYLSLFIFTISLCFFLVGKLLTSHTFCTGFQCLDVWMLTQIFRGWNRLELLDYFRMSRVFEQPCFFKLYKKEHWNRVLLKILVDKAEQSKVSGNDGTTTGIIKSMTCN